MSGVVDPTPSAGDELVRVVVGRIGRPHGVRGQVRVEVRTDDVDRRFAVGNRLIAASLGPLTVASTRRQGGHLVVGFVGVDDRSAAERLRGRFLEADVAVDEAPGAADEYYDRSLLDLQVVSVRQGEFAGRVKEVLHLPGQDLLVVADAAGREVLVPFVAAIVKLVDVKAGRIEVELPPGLVEADE